MKIFSEDIELLKELLIKEKIDMYYFHEKYMLSPAQLGRTIRKYEALNIISLENNIILLTSKGKQWIFKHRKELFLYERPKYWKEIPQEMLQEKIKINELYKPNPKKIGSDLFNNTEDGN